MNKIGVVIASNAIHVPDFLTIHARLHMVVLTDDGHAVSQGVADPPPDSRLSVIPFRQSKYSDSPSAVGV
jgi:hypothetical protein